MKRRGVKEGLVCKNGRIERLLPGIQNNLRVAPTECASLIPSTSCSIRVPRHLPSGCARHFFGYTHLRFALGADFARGDSFAAVACLESRSRLSLGSLSSRKGLYSGTRLRPRRWNYGQSADVTSGNCFFGRIQRLGLRNTRFHDVTFVTVDFRCRCSDGLG